MRLFRRRPKQTTFVYCPHCRYELVAGGLLIGDDEDGVKYLCASCRTYSRWLFDAPVPLLVEPEAMD